MTLRLFLNELSLEGMADLEALRLALAAVIAARRGSANLARILYCSRNTGQVQAIYGQPLLMSLQQFPKEERTAILQWLGRSGPFLDDERQEVDQDLYHLYGAEVTDIGPGEAARQQQRGTDGRLFSFVHREDVDFRTTPLPVVHGFPDQPLAEVLVPNLHDLSAAKAVADAADPEPRSWGELLDISRRRFGRLLIGRHCDEVLAPLPFYSTVARRTLELLRVLDALMEQIDTEGALTAPGKALRQDHFVGGKAWFTGESDENQRLFAAEMTFPDPDDPSRRIQCFWHGKIKTPQFRIHFEWPLPTGARTLKVVYIGPKISKK